MGSSNLLSMTVLPSETLKYMGISQIGNTFWFFQHLYWSIIALQWLVSALQQSESVIHIHMFPYLFPLASPFHPPYPTPLGGHKAQS